MPDRPYLSAAIMGRNEARFVGRCLDSLAGVVDEIVFLDTGSTDQTVDIVLAHGFNATPELKVRHWAWRDDFSAARNEVASHVTGRWILSIDCDEHLEGPWTEPGALKAKLRDLEERYREDWPLLICRVPMLDKDVKETVTFGRGHHLRIYPNHERIYYQSPIHNRLSIRKDTPEEETARIVDIPDEGLLMIHRGYDPTVYRERKKSERAMRILNRQVEEGNADALTRFYIGREHHHMQQYAEAVPHLKEALGGLEYASLQGAQRLPCWDLLITCMHQAGHETPDIVEEAAKAITTYPHAPDLFYTIGIVMTERKEWDRALIAFEACEKNLDHPESRNYACTIPYRRWELYFNMAQLHAQLGVLRDDREHVRKGMEYLDRVGETYPDESIAEAVAAYGKEMR